MSDLFLGWDVGAWNCDGNRESRDALCALEIGESGPVVVGKPWRGNVRDLLVTHEGARSSMRCSCDSTWLPTRRGT